MAVYDLEEQEQISRLKAWWEQYGNLVTTVALVAALTAVGWQALQWYRSNQAAEAGALYFAVQQAAAEGDAQKAREAAGQIIEKYSRTVYAEMAALLSAGVQVSADERRNARAQLEWLADKGRDPVLQDIARLRLASMLLDEGAHTEALKRLEPAPSASLKARFEDLRGDILASNGRHQEARAAYQAALDTLEREAAQGVAPGGDTLREVIRVKLEALEA